MIHPAGHERLPNGATSRIHHTDCPEQLTDPEKWIDKPPQSPATSDIRARASWTGRVRGGWIARADSSSGFQKSSRFQKGAPTNAELDCQARGNSMKHHVPQRNFMCRSWSIEPLRSASSTTAVTSNLSRVIAPCGCRKVRYPRHCTRWPCAPESAATPATGRNHSATRPPRRRPNGNLTSPTCRHRASVQQLPVNL